MDIESKISRRSRDLVPSGIRRVFERASRMSDPINFSIGQPDFPVPDSIKRAAKRAIDENQNGYTLTKGIQPLIEAIERRIHDEFDWSFAPAGSGESSHASLVTGGTSGGLFLAYFALAEEGDEIIIPDPYFVVYPQMGHMVGATVRYCDTYPDFRMTAARIEPLITKKTKFVLINSPSNPSGVTMTKREIRDVVDLCIGRGVILVSDEIYDEFTYADGRDKDGKHISPGRFSSDVLVLRGFGKSYGVTGWRLGFAVGPSPLIQQMSKVHQYAYVCAPSMAQWGGLAAFETDMRPVIRHYEHKRDLVQSTLGSVTELAHPNGAFYAFPKVPEELEMSATQFAELAVRHNVVVIPGEVFSRRDTHFRISFAVDDDRLKRGLEILARLMRGEETVRL